MAPQLPVSVTMPKWLSTEQLVGATGCAGGIFFGDYMAATIVSAAGQSGMAALGVAALSKAVLGMGLFYAAGRTRGGTATALGLGAVGATASIIIDVVRYVWPTAETPAARLRASYRGIPAVRVAPPAVVARLRAETPSGEALGGF